jgi:hypothetical protein
MILSSMFLARYGKVLGIALAFTLAAWWLTAKYNDALEQADQQGYERAMRENKAAVDKANAAQYQRDAAARAQHQAKESEWIGERSELETQIASLAARPPVVRLCKPAPADHREVPGAVAAAGSTGGAGQPAFDALSPGRDVGPELTRLLGECERYRRRLIELQGRWPQ